jgi:hypothetical protein
MKGDLMSSDGGKRRSFFFLVGSEAEYRSMLHIYWIPDNKASFFPMKVKSLMVRFFFGL